MLSEQQLVTDMYKVLGININAQGRCCYNTDRWCYPDTESPLYSPVYEFPPDRTGSGTSPLGVFSL